MLPSVWTLVSLFLGIDDYRIEREDRPADLETCVSSIKNNIVCDDEDVETDIFLCNMYAHISLCYETYIPSIEHPDHQSVLSSMHNHCSAIDPAISRQVMSRRQVPLPTLLSSSVDPFPQTSLLQQTNSLGVVTGIPGALTIVSNLAPQMTSLASAGASAGVLLSSRLASLSSILASAGPNPSIANSIASVESVLRAGTTASPPSTLSTVSSVTSSTTQSSTGGSGGTSSPSAGLIAGAVIGSVAALALIGIFVLLFLRHRRGKPAKTNETEQVEKAELEGQGISYGRQEVGEAEKPELATKANAWELQGNGPTMGAANAHGGTGPWELPGHAEQIRGSLPAGQR